MRNAKDAGKERGQKQRKKGWSRRYFLTVGAAAGFSQVLPGGLQAARPSRQDSEILDVAIVGAGISGLVAARELEKRSITNLAVFEARDRVGGRTINHDIGNGHVAEGGGQWVGPKQTAILDLCRELDIGTFPSHLDGKIVYDTGDRHHLIPYQETRSPSSRVARKIDQLAQSVPLEAPWKAEKAIEWDSMSVADWAKLNKIRGQQYEDLATATAVTLGAAPSQLSLLYFLFYVHSAGSYDEMEGFRGGAQDSRIEGGSQRISLEIAKTLGERVHLTSPIRRITRAEGRVSLETPSGTVHAKQLIMALMPGSCTRIEFEPKLPDSRQQLQEQWVREPSAVKYNVVYDKPFWREDGRNGMAVSNGPVLLAVDNSPPDASLGVSMILTDKNVLPAEAGQRRKAILQALVDLFGEPAGQPIGFHEMDWSREEFTGGCVSPLGPGVLTRYGASLRESVGRIHWAGTEAAEVWTGYMDGAVRAGQAAAGRVADLL